MQDEDGLIDYNEDPEYNEDPGQPPSHTPPHTPMALENENEGEGEDINDLEEGRKADEDIRAAELARREKHHKEFEALSLKLAYPDSVLPW